MSLKNAFAALFASGNDEKEKVEHGHWLGSSRFLLTLGLLAVIIYLTKGILTDTLWIICGVIVVTYLVTNTWSKTVAMKVNAEVIKERQRLAWADGSLSAVEAEALKRADDASAAVSAAVGAGPTKA